MASIELLRQFASSKLPFRLTAAEAFNGAKALAASGYIKLAMPPVQKGRGAYGQQDAALVLAITPAGKRALTPQAD